MVSHGRSAPLANAMLPHMLHARDALALLRVPEPQTCPADGPSKSAHIAQGGQLRPHSERFECMPCAISGITSLGVKMLQGVKSSGCCMPPLRLAEPAPAHTNG